MGIQMIASILICTWFGRWLDEYMNTSKPLFTIALILLGIAASSIVLIRGIKRISDTKEDANQK